MQKSCLEFYTIYSLSEFQHLYLFDRLIQVFHSDLEKLEFFCKIFQKFILFYVFKKKTYQGKNINVKELEPDEFQCWAPLPLFSYGIQID